MSSAAKAHTSPSKASYGRTYDSKLVTREMHRLAHLPTGLSPSLSQAPSASSLSLPSSVTTQTSIVSSSSSDPWGQLHVHVLPLFNLEPLRVPIEDLNVLVKRHIQTVVSSSPAKALATLENDAAELIDQGMVTLNAQLASINDDELIGRVVEVWGFFWDRILTYVEGVLLPLQTDPLLSSLYRAPNPGRQASKGSISSSLSGSASHHQIDVRTVALRSFRDKVLLPRSSRLYSRLTTVNRQDSSQKTSYQQPRLQQMLLVLASEGHQRTPTLSLTSLPPQLGTAESAVADLLRALRSPRQLGTQPTTKVTSRAPSFLSGGLPRDRRGRIAQKRRTKGPGLLALGLEEEDELGEETPRGATGLLEMDRERERAMLESLRSPDAMKGPTGGWGLGAGQEDASKREEEEEELLSWEEAQVAVERMVGMKPDQQRRRLT